VYLGPCYLFQFSLVQLFYLALCEQIPSCFSAMLHNNTKQRKNVSVSLCATVFCVGIQICQKADNFKLLDKR
jgi:hypothetical protein